MPKIGTLAALALVLMSTARAHHSFVGFYDQSQIVEIEGVLRSASWRNPHGTLEVDVIDADGGTTPWVVETGSVGVLRVRGFDREFVQPGDRIRIAGEPALRRENGLYARNMLLPSGEEVMLSIGIEPRWTGAGTAEMLEAQFDEDVRSSAVQSAEGIFRVWATVLDDPESFPLFKGGYPLTAEAQAIKANWDSSDVVQLGCLDKGMPSLMITPYPIEFVDQGDRILIRFEEDDAERIVRLGSAPTDSAVEPSLLGSSIGRWEDGRLIVTTVGLGAGYLDSEGTPMSDAARLVETFSMAPDGTRLDYTLHVDDPGHFTEPFELERYWIWRPELEVKPYDCGVQQP